MQLVLVLVLVVVVMLVLVLVLEYTRSDGDMLCYMLMSAILAEEAAVLLIARRKQRERSLWLAVASCC